MYSQDSTDLIGNAESGTVLECYKDIMQNAICADGMTTLYSCSGTLAHTKMTSPLVRSKFS